MCSDGDSEVQRHSLGLKRLAASPMAEAWSTQNLYEGQMRLKHTDLKSAYCFLINRAKASLVILLVPLYECRSHRLDKNLKVA